MRETLSEVTEVNLQSGARIRHKQNGLTYVVLHRSILKIRGDLDGLPMVTYRDHNMRVYNRPLTEFIDGTFHLVRQRSSDA